MLKAHLLFVPKSALQRLNLQPLLPEYPRENLSMRFDPPPVFSHPFLDLGVLGLKNFRSTIPI